MKVLMVGAAGDYARFVLPQLKRRGAILRALIRQESAANEAGEQGADETVIGDLTDKATLVEAARNVNGVFHINPAFRSLPAGSRLSSAVASHFLTRRRRNPAMSTIAT